MSDPVQIAKQRLGELQNNISRLEMEIADAKVSAENLTSFIQMAESLTSGSDRGVKFEGAGKLVRVKARILAGRIAKVLMGVSHPLKPRDIFPLLERAGWRPGNNPLVHINTTMIRRPDLFEKTDAGFGLKTKSVEFY